MSSWAISSRPGPDSACSRTARCASAPATRTAAKRLWRPLRSPPRPEPTASQEPLAALRLKKAPSCKRLFPWEFRVTAPLAQLDFSGGQSFQVVLADLLKETTDGIVNAANGHLAHGGGVALVIDRAAGPELDAEGRRLVQRDGPVATGGAMFTSAGAARCPG